MNDYGLIDMILASFVGMAIISLILLVCVMTKAVGCTQSFQQEAIDNECAVMVCDRNGVCKFEWGCQ